MLTSRRRFGGLFVALILLVAAGAWAQAPGVLKSWDFETDLAGWLSLDPQATLRQATEPGNFLGGAAALELTYSMPARPAPGAMPPGPVAPLAAPPAELQSLAFAVKTTAAANLAVVLTEKNGSVYMAPFFAASGAWHQLTFVLSDFTPIEDQRTPRDPDGQLDADQLAAVGVVDISGMMAGLTRAAPFTSYNPGERKLWLDDFRLLSTAPPAEALTPVPDDPVTLLDTCDREPFRWAVLGGRQVEVSVAPGAAPDPGAYRIAYTLPADTLFALLHVVAPGRLTGTRELHLAVRAEQDLKLYVAVGLKDQSRFIWNIDIPAGEEWSDLSPPWDAFKPENPGAGGPAAPDPAQIVLVAVADISGIEAGQEAHNVLWLDNLYGTR